MTNKDLDENNNVILEFKHNDTQFLLPGVYYYQIKAYFPYGTVSDEDSGIRDAEVHTIIPKTKFIIVE